MLMSWSCRAWLLAWLEHVEVLAGHAHHAWLFQCMHSMPGCLPGVFRGLHRMCADLHGLQGNVLLRQGLSGWFHVNHLCCGVVL